MVTIRPASFADLIPIGELALQAKEQSPLREYHFHLGRFKQTCMAAIRSPNHMVWIAEKEGEAVGCLIGMVDSIYGWFEEKAATDLFFYVNEKGRGAGLGLFRRFLEWVRKRDDVAIVVLQTGSGIGDLERVGSLYERFGFVRYGSLYRLKPDSQLTGVKNEQYC